MVETMVRPAILGCRDYIPGKPVEEVEREYGITDIIKMASNENPLGTSKMAMEAMIDELKKNVNRYPESGCVKLVQKLAEIHGLSENQFYVDNGLDAVITMMGLTFISPGDEIIYGDITFPAYGNITRKMGGTFVEVPVTGDCRLDLEAFAGAVTDRTKIIFVCNPNNPTGTISTKKEVEALLSKVPENVLVVMDEAYYDFAEKKEYPQTVPMLKEHKNMIVLRTFSKIMGMASLRIGYAMADPDIVQMMKKAREPFPVNRIAQAGALSALDDKEFVEEVTKLNYEGRFQYHQAFNEMGLTSFESQTNFVYVEIGGYSSQEIFVKMLKDGVIIRPQSFEGRPDALRITIGTKEENERTITSLKKALLK